jgi:IclR family pca regulon transcriptional regulator
VDEVKESCSAAVLDGTDIVYVLRVPTRKIMSISLGVGSRLPAYCTSMGRMLLAALPDDEVEALLQASRRPPAPPHADRRGRRAGQGAAGAQAGLVPGEPGTGRRPGVDGRADRGPRRPTPSPPSTSAARPTAPAPRQMQETMLPQLLAAAQAISRMLSVQRT